jgi:hypothetical protein
MLHSTVRSDFPVFSFEEDVILWRRYHRLADSLAFAVPARGQHLSSNVMPKK